MKASFMKTVSIKLQPELDRELSAAAKARGTTKSDLVRDMLKIYLASAGGPQPGSCLERWGSLVGSVEGPEDLSTNKQYMADFGK